MTVLRPRPLLQVPRPANFNRIHEAPTIEDRVSITLGRTTNTEHSRVALSPEVLLGRHCAILGTTGSGKSWTLARLIEEMTKYDSKVILFDASGEFHTLKKGVQHIRIGTSGNDNSDVRQVGVPYYHLRETDLFAIFKPNGPSQAPKLRAAMKSLKLARLSPQLAADGTIMKAHRSKVQYEEQYRRFQSEIDSPYPTFDIFLLASQIQNECVDPQRSALEPLVWGGLNGQELSHCVPLLNRIQDIVQNPSLNSIFKPKGLPSIFDVLSEFFTDSSANVLRICLRDLPFEHNAREIVTNAIGLHLLDLGRKGAFLSNPMVLVVDEAHQFLKPIVGSGIDCQYPLDAFGILAKEGRKYAVNICLATQRPRDIPEDVLSQMGAMVVHRLINPGDRSVVERACGELDSTSAAAIPRFQPGEGIVVGAGLYNPITLSVTAPECKPDSRGPDFQLHWWKGEGAER